MNKAELVTKLSEIIDSEEKWDDLKTRMLIHGFAVQERIGGSLNDVLRQRTEKDPWWAQREAARIKYEVYDETDVTKAVNKNMPGLFVHISQEDRNFVAYTVDGEAGKRDKQLKIAPGRFLRKFFPLYTDNYINELVAKHLGDANAVVEYLTTYDEIVEAYTPSLDSSCMTVGKITIDGLHPPAAVLCNLPNIKLAVLRTNGSVTARTWVRTDTKKYIRIYGNKQLEQALKREGYGPGTFVGAKLNTVPVQAVRDVYVMPYLDGNGTRGSTEHSTVALISGDIYVVPPYAAQEVRSKVNGALAYATNTSGTVVLYSGVELSDFTFTDFITGQTVNLLTTATDSIKDVYSQGRIHRTAEQVENLGFVRACIRSEWRTPVIYARKEDCFLHGDTFYVDNEETRRHVGYVKLDAGLYPDEQGWTYLSVVVETDGGANIKLGDSVTVICKVGAKHAGKRVHKSVITKEHVRVHSATRGTLVYAEPGVEVSRTVSGRKVVAGYHDVCFLEDLGAIDFSRNAKGSTTLLSKTYYFSTRGVPEDFQHLGRVHVELTAGRLKEILARCTNETEAAIETVKCICSIVYLGVVGGIRIEYYNVRPEQLKAIKENIDNLHTSARETTFITTLIGCFDDRVLQLAEAQAVEYPNKLEEFSEELITA